MVCVATQDTFQVKINGTWFTLILMNQVISLSHPFEVLPARKNILHLIYLAAECFTGVLSINFI